MDAEALRESDRLHGLVQAFVRGDRAHARDPLLLEIAAFQLRHVEPVARLHRALHGSALPSQPSEIVALPTDVFRMRRVAAHPPALDTRVFLTSGTTQGTRGAHALRTLATYQAAALAWGRAWLLPAQPPASRALVLAPRSEDAPESSLSFMIDLFVREAKLEAEYLLEGGALDAARVAAALDRASSAAAPVLVFGTAFAFVFAQDALGGRRWQLPRGSALMITGGFKGRSRVVPEAELRASLRQLLGLDEDEVIGEYGMTELSSQLYEPRRSVSGLPGSIYRPPPWLVIEAVDPETLAPLPAGTRGIARILDLANVDSSLGIQTQDLIEVLPSGDVQLFGRLPGATPRGCSLAIEELAGDLPLGEPAP